MIAKLEKDWHQYPVFKIDFNGVNFMEKGNLEATIEYYLANWEKIYGETPVRFLWGSGSNKYFL